jgi:hypothetical protein
MPPVSHGVGYPITYQYDITLIDNRKSAGADRLGEPSACRHRGSLHVTSEHATEIGRDG